MFDRVFLNVLDGFFYLRYPNICRRFFLEQRRLPHIALPRDYSDRMQWRKVFDHNPLFVVFADKLAAKEFVARTVPGLALPKVLWIGNSVDDIPATLLSGNVVVKANHGSGFNYFVREGVYDLHDLRQASRRWMAVQAFCRSHAEWSYSRVSPKLFVEEMLAPSDASDGMIEINIRAGCGRLAFGTLLLYAKTPKQSSIYIDKSRRVVGRTLGTGMDPREIERVPIPDLYDEAVQHALIMSRHIDYARFDFFCSGGKLYGGEVTAYPNSGYGSIPSFPSDSPQRRSSELAHAILDVWDLHAAWFMTAPLSGWREFYREILLRHVFETERSSRQASPVTYSRG